MDWKKAAEADLRSYEDRLKALENIKTRIAAQKLNLEGLKAAAADKEPVKGGTSRHDDRMINSIVEIERLKRNYGVTSRLVQFIEKGLSGLNSEERDVLDCFYINREYRHIDTLRDKLHLEKSQIYKLKDLALYKFTISCYGIIDL